YSVTDDAGNTVWRSRALVIDDGTFVIDSGYILRASSFIISVSQVNMQDKEGQIKARSGAQAWTTDGNALPSGDIGVPDNGGYQNVIGLYDGIKLSLSADPSLVRVIAALVVGDDKEIENGDRYSIFAGDFRINVIDANALADAAASVIEAQFIARSGVASYLRSGLMANEEGTKRLVSAVKVAGVNPDNPGASFESFGAAPATPLVQDDEFDVTFWVDEDHTATVTVRLTVSNAWAPTLTVPAVKVVPFISTAGATFAEGTPTDTVPTYMQGVTAFDSEDGPLTNITHNTPVNFDNPRAIFRVTYSVSDSDYNTTSQDGMVLIGDNWFLYEGYAISAYDFSIDLEDVDGTDQEMIDEAQAIALDVRRYLPGGAVNPAYGNLVPIVILDDSGYHEKRPGDFPVTFAVGEDQNVYVDIVAQVRAQWVLTYDGNGHTGGTVPAPVSYNNGDIAVVAANTVTKTGSSFLGYSLNPGFTPTALGTSSTAGVVPAAGGDILYQPGDTILMDSHKTLYVIWEADVVYATPPTGDNLSLLEVALLGFATALELFIIFFIKRRKDEKEKATVTVRAA
ncbi:MAG: hypothetical protein LBG81_04280, partial [Coriobacteriaceae bacterium]|nr:hypothetical protein [Coriobacteriaceae bacterium]